MKVYLAAQYPRRNEMRQAASILRFNGIEVTSRWLEEIAPLTSQLHDASASENSNGAITDKEDIERADAVVRFSESPTLGLPRGAHHTEFGLAMGLGKKLIVIGGPENIFDYLPNVIHYSTLTGFLDAEKGV
jgi:hypothetical protein